MKCFKLRIGNRIFAPRLIPSVVTLLLLPVLLRLGVWQLDRAEQKQQLIDLYQQQAHAAPLRIQGLLQEKPELNYRDVQVVGSYLAEKQIFLDNQIHDQQVGYHVVTPFRIKDTNLAILVDRGWVAMGKDRQQLPDIRTQTAEVTLAGKLKLLDSKPFMLGDQYQSNQGWPALVQWLNIEDIAKKSGLTLQPVILLLDAKQADGFVRDWKPVVMQPEKNISYAVQWFTMAAVLVIIYLVVNLKKIESESFDE